MTLADFQTLNQVADAREWARTARDPRDKGRSETEVAPSREDEQRYNQTTTPTSTTRIEGDEDSAVPKTVREADRLVGNQLAWAVGTVRDVHRSRHGLPSTLDHSGSPSARLGTQIEHFSRTLSRVFGRHS